MDGVRPYMIETMNEQLMMEARPLVWGFTYKFIIIWPQSELPKSKISFTSLYPCPYELLHIHIICLHEKNKTNFVCCINIRNCPCYPLSVHCHLLIQLGISSSFPAYSCSCSSKHVLQRKLLLSLNSSQKIEIPARPIFR